MWRVAIYSYPKHSIECLTITSICFDCSNWKLLCMQLCTLDVHYNFIKSPSLTIFSKSASCSHNVCYSTHQLLIFVCLILEYISIPLCCVSECGLLHITISWYFTTAVTYFLVAFSLYLTNLPTLSANVCHVKELLKTHWLLPRDIIYTFSRGRKLHYLLKYSLVSCSNFSVSRAACIDRRVWIMIILYSLTTKSASKPEWPLKIVLHLNCIIQWNRVTWNGRTALLFDIVLLILILLT